MATQDIQPDQATSDRLIAAGESERVARAKAKSVAIRKERGVNRGVQAAAPPAAEPAGAPDTGPPLAPRPHRRGGPPEGPRGRRPPRGLVGTGAGSPRRSGPRGWPRRSPPRGVPAGPARP